ncbi:MAG: tetratricopeptide repeat protein, partial [Deltaproteobacteria bacterium]|nr:tetratricopeptide repeat protein [Deltaproteobacteria bacterium]
MNKVWVILFHLFWLTHPGLVTAADLSHHPFSQAYALFDEGKFTEAAPRFREALDQKDALEDYSLYFLGVIAFTGDSNEEARGYFSRLKKGFPRSVWLSDATFHLARIELREGKPQETIQLLKALDSKSVGEPLHTESLFLLGQTYQDQKDPKQAHAAYQRLRANYPLTPWAGKAKEEVQSLRAKFPELLVPKDPDSLTKEADILLGELDFAAAEKIFLNFPGRKTDKKLRFSYLTGLAEVYRWARRRVREKEILKEIVREYPQTSEASDAFYRIAEIQWNQGKNQEALKRFKQLQERYPQNSNVDHAEFARGRIFESLKVPSEAIKVYSGFAKKFPRSRWRVEAAWRLAWIHYLAGDY